ncbi:YheC/YheD family protein [Salipaludibacillus aurantiacus]|uniref:YheC/D like ATP-grasp n=1 Tax=Salipaludibacillus aurantiacus TaxID=1601833 RepID=A0A1H9UN00_9BACI|nr:YheC/YheD family protein [Salipaludibacillus aurantiacus]SES10732.1 YheC/D like ATP-grasp [Salipaludibacillus aurantiacus]
MSTSSPVIGLLCRAKMKKSLLRQKVSFRARLSYRAGLQTGATVYFFTAKDFIKQRNKIKGVYYDKSQKKWRRKLFPFPDIIFRLGGTYTANKYPSFNRSLKSHKTIVLNRLKSFDKYTQYKVLRKKSSTASALPITRELSLSKKQQLFQFINRHSNVYIKAKYSFQSRGVMRVRKKGTNSFEYLYFYRKRIKRGTVSKTQLMKTLTSFFKRKTLFIQKEIPIFTHSGKPFDIRVEMNKTPEGKPKVSAYCVKEHPKGVFTSKNSNSYKLRNFFRMKYNYSDQYVTSLIKKIDQVCYTTYEVLESGYGPLGEISVDLGLDKKGELWIIEANLCSGKRAFYMTYGSANVKRSYVEMFSYAVKKLNRKEFQHERGKSNRYYIIFG